MLIVRGDQIDFEPASHENPADPGVLKRVLAKKDHFIRGHIQMLNWARLPVGKSFQRHFHQDMQEVFIILQGRVEMEVGDISSELDKGDAIFVEPKEIHKMTNVCDQDVEYIVFGVSTEKGGKTIVVE